MKPANTILEAMGYNKEIVVRLFESYLLARKNKRNKTSQLDFEINFEEQLFELYQAIVLQTYEPRPSYCFMVDYPVMREIFAASFRDRVIHHFIFSYLYPLVEKTLIYDVYSCRTGKGTLKGIRRAASFMQSCSDNYTADCYVLKLDIAGYFMSIYKPLLYDKVASIVQKHAAQLAIDKDILMALVRGNIFHNPIHNCIFKSRQDKWEGLPYNKSLFHTATDCGLPIGNITSQLYGNLYLNDFDHWVKKELGFKYYGRYVDDICIFHKDKSKLQDAIRIISKRLLIHERLTLHPSKIYLQHYTKGLAFLGVYILPGRIYAGNRLKAGIYNKANTLKEELTSNIFNIERFVSSINSYLGLLKYHNTFNLRKKILNDITIIFADTRADIKAVNNMYNSLNIKNICV